MVYGSCMLEMSLAELEDSKQHVVTSLTCRAGIIKLQAQLERDPVLMGPLILSCIKHTFWVIVQDQYGNYLVQKLLPHLSLSQIDRAHKALSPCFVEVCMSLYGSSVIHKLIDALKGTQLEEKFVTLTVPYISILATNQYGVHILIHMVDAFDAGSIVVNATIKDVLRLSKDRFGCGLIKHLITQSQLIKDTILPSMAELSMDPFGNFTVQHVMTFGNESEVWMCLATLKDHLVELALNKSGSNVLETLIEASNTSQRIFLADTFMNDLNTLLLWSEHEFGNYVVQRLLQCGSCYQQDQMRIVLRGHFSKSLPPIHSKHLYELVSE